MKAPSHPAAAAAVRPRSIRPRSLTRRLERHFLSCTALAALGAGTARAEVHYSGMLSLTIPKDNDIGVSVDFDAGMIATGPMTLSGFDLNLFEQTGTQLLQSRTPDGVGGVLGFTNGAYTYTQNLGPGVSVGPGGGFLGGINVLGAIDSQGAGASHGQFAGGVSGAFIGLRFFSPAPGNPTLYGWARLDVTPGLQATLVDYAFEDSGGAILTGVVPEPSPLALGCLAAGATGLAVWRRRRRGQGNP